MRARLILLPMLFACAAATAFATAGLIFRSGADTRRHVDLISRFEEVVQIEGVMDRHVLDIIAGMLPHYDPLMVQEHRLTARQAAMARQSGIADDPTTAAAWQVYARVTAAKLEEMDRIKRSAAFVANQESYLPSALEAYRVDESRREGEVDLLDRGLILALSARVGDDVPLRLRQMLSPLEHRVGADPDGALAHIIGHLTRLTEQRQALLRAKEAYFAQPSAAALANARDAYLAAYAARRAEALQKVWVLLGLTVGLLAALGALLVLLGRANRRTRTARDTMRKLDIAVEQSPIAILITDRDGAVEYANPCFTRLTGWGRDEVLGANPRILGSGANPPEIFAELWRTITAGLVWQGELINRKKDGALFIGREVISPVTDAEGAITHFVAMMEDITSLRAGEERLADANSEIKRLLFAASHDLQEPVRSVTLFSQLLQRQVGTALGDDARESLHFILTGTKQLRHMITGLATFARSDHTAAPFVPVSLNGVTNLVIKDLSRDLEESEAVFERDDLPTVLGDSGLLGVMFDAVLGNALKFRSPERTPHIRLSAGRDGARWIIEVADNGIGIAEEDLNDLIRPFSRLHGREAYPGAGLGLATAQRIARLHGGGLDLLSRPGEGTTVRITLPATAEPAD